MELRPPVGDESNLELVTLIAEEIESTGPITFARFMELAIGHPQHGYYAASVERVGTEGDFLTAPETHPIFGWLLARQVVECWRALGAEPVLRLLELGAGRGTLARQVLNAVGAMAPEGLTKVHYELLDLNPEHGRFAERATDGTETIEHIVGPATGEAVEGVIIANEYLDALPFHRITNRDGRIGELYVDVTDGWFVERFGDVSSDVTRMLTASFELAPGQVVEVAPEVERSIQDLARQLERGFAFLIDYGYEQPDIHDAERFPRGSLKTYRLHEVGEDPFHNVGHQDITAHVDFSLVMDTARTAGLDVAGITSLAEFCAGLGLDAALMEIQEAATTSDEYLAARTAAMALLDPSGLGRFRVLVLSRGIEAAVDLSGLSFRMPGL